MIPINLPNMKMSPLKITRFNVSWVSPAVSCTILKIWTIKRGTKAFLTKRGVPWRVPSAGGHGRKLWARLL